jgi:nucleoid-associated protein YgaU
MRPARGSRYYTGIPQQITHKTTGDYTTAVYRVFPGTVKISYTEYTWTEGDSLDYLAAAFLGNPKLWWQIMDINPTISDPLTIEPGTVIRIPRV